MEDYRALHRARYLEREREREAAAEAATVLAEAAALEARERVAAVARAFNSLHCLIDDVRQQTNILAIRDTLNQAEMVLVDMPAERDLVQIGLDFLEAVNANVHTRANFNNMYQVELSREIQKIMKGILHKCGVIDGTEDLDVDYEMDTSNDAELAARLAAELHELPPLPMLRQPPLPPHDASDSSDASSGPRNRRRQQRPRRPRA